MNEFENTNLPFLEKDCIETFGEEQGKKVFDKTIELCQIYCENDNIAFSGLLPKIRFERAGTIGEGAECCDFHFIKING